MDGFRRSNFNYPLSAATLSKVESTRWSPRGKLVRDSATQTDFVEDLSSSIQEDEAAAGSPNIDKTPNPMEGVTLTTAAQEQSHKGSGTIVQ
ncbi:hypothetical protein BGZ54_008626 [Gamsiella multidivaricata]|nr:hypothetical protein BGZ54_008626 [Gamsiella multidivaricata]